MLSSYSQYCTDHIQGFNVQMNSNHISHLRLNISMDLSSCQKLRMAHHNQKLLAIEQSDEKTLRRLHWGILPNWWQTHPKYTGIPIYYINTQKLNLSAYRNSSFALIPIKNIVLKQASVFSQIWPLDDNQHIWCIGIVDHDHLQSKVAFIQKPDKTLLTIEERKIKQFFRAKAFGQSLKHLLREALSRQLNSTCLNAVLPLEQKFN